MLPLKHKRSSGGQIVTSASICGLTVDVETVEWNTSRCIKCKFQSIGESLCLAEQRLDFGSLQKMFVTQRGYQE